MKHLVQGLILLSMLTGCAWTWNWARHNIAVEVQHQPPQAKPWQDQELTLDHMVLTMTALRIERCDTQPQGYATLLAPSQAHAHGVSDPTRLADFFLVDLMAPQTTYAAGAWTPTGGSYCRVSVLLGTADDDTWGLEEQPWMQDHSAGLQGSYQGQPIQWRTTSAYEITRTLDPPLLLDRDEDQSARLTFSFSLDNLSTWNTDEALQQAQQDQRLPDALLLAIGQSMTLTLERP